MMKNLIYDESLTNRGIQKEANNPWVIDPWQPRDMDIVLLILNMITTLYSDESN
ncbi:MAG: hypothetical protein ACFCUM_01505 [Bacteroidales bacterium]